MKMEKSKMTFEDFVKAKENTVVLKVKLDGKAFPIGKAHDTDAGYDILTPYGFELYPGTANFIDTGVHIAIPEGYWGKVQSKSGLCKKHGIIVTGAVDSGYTGSIGCNLINTGDHAVKFERGDKIAQLIIEVLPNTIVTYVPELDETERGDGGFGSTGR